jgi:hypothetical protein
MKRLNRIFTNIAATHLNIPTLRTRRSDRLDFHDVSVWAVRSALKAAFDAGLGSADTIEPERTPKTARAALLLLDMVRYSVISFADGDCEFQGTVYVFDAVAPDWLALVDAIGWDTAAAAVLAGAAR